MGGRFNIGNINPDHIPIFSALYLAEDKTTAEKELLTLSNVPFNISQKMSIFNLALTESISTVNVSGELDMVLDIRNEGQLEKVITILKKFQISSHLKRKGQGLNKIPKVIRTKKNLLESIMESHWRYNPTIFDIPSNSQIFGQMVRASGISGILYYSKHTKKKCLAIFPSNLKNSASFIELLDKPPNNKIPVKIDHSNFNICETDFLKLK